MSVVIETTIGDITVDLYLKERPNTCLNFLKLCKMKYYNLCLFYKIEKNFIAQTGDPTATGRGGESVFSHLYGDQAKYFDAESKPRLKHEKLGTLSMVNNGNNMNGSQFFFTLSENLTYLDEDHSVFGEVAEGLEVLQKLNDAICDTNNRPYQDIRITHTVVLHDPFEDPKGLPIPDASPEPTKEMLESNYIGADEEIDDNEGKTAEEIEEKIKESEAKARATILEMVGDIPDAEVKPPENVLFVCKLNPVTTSEDLEIIFSRFGKILSCEVIKDKKTGDSLQYAFIEFEEEKSCEDAFFKMNNVLIDDRRIRVDWSQSTSKLGKVGNSKVKSNFSLKQTGRNDDYEMIFDMGDVPIDNKQKEDKHYKSRSNDTRKEHKKYNQKDHEKRYKDGDRFERSKERRSDTYDKSKSRYLEQSSSRNYRETDRHHRKFESSPKHLKRSGKRDSSISPEYRKNVRHSSGSRHYKESEKKRRYDSPSPEYGRESQESFSKHNKELKKKTSYDSKKAAELSSKHKEDSKKRNRYDSKSPEHPKKTAESFPKGLESRRKNASVSPDRTKNYSSKYRDESREHYSKTKHSSKKHDHHEYSRNKSQGGTEKTESDSTSNKYKADVPRKTPLLEKSNKSKRKTPISSSSSSSDSDSSSSSSSSSSSDSDYKEKHRKQKNVSRSHKKSKSHKKRKL